MKHGFTFSGRGPHARRALWCAWVASAIVLTACGGGGGGSGVVSTDPALAAQINEVKPSSTNDTVSVFVQLGGSSAAGGANAVTDPDVQRQQLQAQFLADLQRVVARPVAGAASTTSCDPVALSGRIASAFKPSSGAAVRLELSACELDLLPQISNVKGVHADIPLAFNANAADALALEVKRAFDGVTAWPTLPASSTNKADGVGKIVAILDTGVEPRHPALSGKVLPGACFSTTSSTAQGFCPNGSNSDTTSATAGYACIETYRDSTNAANRTEAIQAGCSHGTSMAGVAAMDYSGTSGSSAHGGVAKGAQVLPVQVFSKTVNEAKIGSNSGDLLAAIEWLTQQADTSAYKGKIVSLNMSLGGGAYTSACDGEYVGGLFKTAFANLRAKGVIPVVAAGNDGNKSAVSFPACVSNTLVVAAAKLNYAGVASYSNFSSQVKVVAPGGDVDGTGQYAMPALCATTTSGYDCWQSGAGTSPATAFVSGAVAALGTVAPSATLNQIETALTTDLTVSLPRLAKTLSATSTLTRPALRVTASAYSLLGLSDPGAPTTPPTYTIGGTVSGLASGQGVTLRNNNSDTLSVQGNGAFTFATPVTQGGGYSVSVVTQPSGQTCTVSNGSGSNVTANVASVAVNCGSGGSGGGSGGTVPGGCTRMPDGIIICMGGGPSAPTPPAPPPPPSLPSHQLCVYSAVNYGGMEACAFWDGTNSRKYTYYGPIKSLRVRAVTFSSTGLTYGEDVSNDSTFKVTLTPMSSKALAVVTHSMTDVTALLPRNAMVRFVKLEKP